MSQFRLMAVPGFSGRRLVAALVMAVCAFGAAQYAPSAQARGFGGSHHGGSHWGSGAIFGAAVIGTALASSYYYNSGYYNSGYYAQPYSPAYYPPAYYPPAVYAPPAPPVSYIEQQPTYASPPPVAYSSPPAPPAPAASQLSVEQRVQRLKEMCDRHLFTPQECASRRQELLQMM